MRMYHRTTVFLCVRIRCPCRLLLKRTAARSLPFLQTMTESRQRRLPATQMVRSQKKKVKKERPVPVPLGGETVAGESGMHAIPGLVGIRVIPTGGVTQERRRQRRESLVEGVDDVTRPEAQTRDAAQQVQMTRSVCLRELRSQQRLRLEGCTVHLTSHGTRAVRNHAHTVGPK